MEDLLQVLVDDGRTLAPTLADGMLACTDGLRQYVDALKTGRTEDDHFAVLAQQLVDAQSACGAAPPASAMEAEPAAAVEASRESGGDAARAKEEVGAANRSDEARQPTIDADLRRRVVATLREQDDDNVLIGKIVFEPNLPLVGLKARLIASKLSNVGDIRYFDPPLDDVENREEIDAIDFGLVTDRSPEAVRRLLHVAGVQQTAIEPLDRRQAPAKTPRGAMPVPPSPAPSPPKPSAWISSGWTADEPGRPIGDRQGPRDADRRPAEEGRGRGQHGPCLRPRRRGVEEDGARRRRLPARRQPPCGSGRSPQHGAAAGVLPGGRAARSGIVCPGPRLRQRPLRDDSPAGSASATAFSRASWTCGCCRSGRCSPASIA